MKKKIALVLAGILCMGALVGCGNDKADGTAKEDGANDQATTQDAKDSDITVSGDITVVSREDGSGTRGAFIELFGIEQKDESGEKVDYTTTEASITNNTSVMMTTVAGDTNAIGYISLGSLNDTVKALKIDGVEASADNVKSEQYKVARPFNIVTNGELSEAATDFVDFILSEQGQAVVDENGYISLDDVKAFESAKPEGKVVVAGSSSVSPVMEKLKEAYAKVNPNVTIEVQTSDSTTGVQSTIDGICDIGMASRALKDSEVESGVASTVIAMDGIAVVVNNDNSVDELSSDQVKNIFTGETLTWEEITK